jgi:hypothetical protein
MKISSDPGMASALDTWLRAEEPGAQSPRSAVADLRPAAPVNAPTPARDTAEALLELDVWGSARSRELASLSAAPQPRDTEPLSSVQGWTDYIFQPLR